MPQVKILIIPRKDGFSRYENITGNFLITSSAEGVNLRAFQMRDMTLTELARSVAFLSQGALTVEVVERSAGLPGNIWRVARSSQEVLSQ